MTKNEVIKSLKLIKSTVYLGNRKFMDAIDCAIESLEQPERRWIPCDWCAYNPPSSMDGKPCTVCPAVANPEPFQKEGDE